MLFIFPAPMNTNHLKKIPSNAKINVGKFHYVIVQLNIRKDDM